MEQSWKKFEKELKADRNLQKRIESALGHKISLHHSKGNDRWQMKSPFRTQLVLRYDYWSLIDNGKNAFIRYISSSGSGFFQQDLGTVRTCKREGASSFRRTFVRVGLAWERGGRI